MNSVAAWGSVPDTLDYIETNGNDYRLRAQPMRAMIEAGIGIRYTPEDRTVIVTTAFCNNEDRFVKKEAYGFLNERLDSGKPEDVLWSGTYSGAGSMVKTRLFVTLTTFFKQVCSSICGDRTVGLGPYPEDHFKKQCNLLRPAGVVPVIRSTILGWINDNANMHGDVLFTSRTLIPYDVADEFPDLDPMEFIDAVYQEYLSAAAVNIEFAQRVANMGDEWNQTGCQTPQLKIVKDEPEDVA